MYRLYNTDSLDQFMAATNRLKQLTQQSGEERLFYKAWSNQALYVFRKQSRTKGLEIANEEKEYAQEHDSKFGLYAATSASTTMMSTMGLIDEAEAGLNESISYLHRYFPGESAAVDYIGLAKIYENRNDYRKMISYAEQALKEPGVSDIHQVAAKSYICVGLAKLAKTPADIEKFNQAYEDFEKIAGETGYDGGLSEVVRYYHARLNGHYAEAMEHARKINSPANRLNFVAEAYTLTGDYKSAYEAHKVFKKYTDSLNSASAKQQTMEHALQLDLIRAEDEAEDLRLINQRQWLFMLMVVALLTIAFLLFYLYRRRQQMKQLKVAYDQLEQTTTEKERYASELRIARNIQMGMVPNTFPAFPERQDIDLFAAMVPAREVGGDLYDYILAGDRLCFCVGDVSGKGVPASMTMTVVMNLFRTFAKDGFSSTEIARRLNDTLAADNENGTFVTMFIGVIDLASGSLDYCNCGHNPPVIIDVQHPSFMETESNVVIGLWPDFQFVGGHVSSILYKPLLIYTDGLTEAENARQEQFGEERLLEVLGWNRFENTQQTVELLLKEVKTHEAGTVPHDDLTMLCIYIK